ncbi:HNH endonuclease [Clostridium sp. 'deep sea']|uniref:HNH endonuclease n=1 Tax=Clostridium sp. 'deep sea' TaxID=2779445 RepID=UPI0018968D78|nr:HNH endonuclease signature motif containing protein [Clostridium sp. 'deep sea']QOR34433.1 HNH endonuclease [Clostridium sp. 'deep sea']
MANIYKSKKWKKKRAQVLRRDNYLCRECRRYGKSVTATTVHHCVPIEEDNSLKLNSHNLISLCSKCHDKMHDRTNNQLTYIGLYWKNKVSPLLSKS